MFMQDMQGLTPLAVAARLLPQALVGLVVSPLVGFIMHKVPGTVLLVIAGISLFLSNILLVFVRHDSNYFSWIFPSLMMSTVGMDWIINVGSLYVLSELPLCHHSIGASLLQTTTRLSVPIGMAVTTAIWSSYEDKGGLSCPEMPYTYTFITTTALSGFALLLIPFIHIGKQGSVSYECFDSPFGDEGKSKSSAHRDSSNRPSKRWSLVDTVSQTSSSSSFMADHRHQQHQHQHHPNRPHWNCTNSSCFCNRPERKTTTSYWSKTSADGPRGATMTDSPGCCGSSTRTNSNPNPHPRTPNNNRNGGGGGGIVWVVCEDCGTKRKRPNANAAGEAGGSVGDPARYFNDPAFGGTASDYSGSSNRSPKTAAAAVPAATPVSSTRPYPGRRRLPLVNREAMTYQMITQGIQP
ncbi:hypothetical protein SLS62_003173 [Diatrype stigma]|uniref:Uncharacterized protein n=1 Tax=Diatrype stigma TaxID=117547 RepID=A0AAN9V5E3_9PEZI